MNKSTSSRPARPSWDHYFMQIAKVVAERSNCLTRKTGAVIVRDKMVLSSGYNGTPRNIKNCNEGGCPRCNSNVESGTHLDKCFCVHGEENISLLNDQMRQIAIDPTIKAYRAQTDTFHYNEDSIGARQSLSSWIYKMPISAYLAIGKKDASSTKQEKDIFVYQTLLPELLKPLRMKFSKRYGSDIEYLVKFENLTDKSNLDGSFFTKILETIPLCRDMETQVVTKGEEPLIFLPDYFLGFVNHCIQGQQWSADSLKLIGNKVGLILMTEEGKKPKLAVSVVVKKS